MNNKPKVITKSVIAVACVAFSTHVGAGFAAGAQEVIYFTGKGWFGPLMPLLTLLILLPVQFAALETARIHKVYNYKEMTVRAYAPFGTIGSWLFEIGVILMMLSSSASIIAGGGSIVNDVLGVDPSSLLGTAIVAVVVAVIIIFGVSAVNTCGTALTVCIIGSLSVITILGIILTKDNIADQWTQQISHASFGNAVWWAVIYAGMQCMTQCMSLSSCSERIQTRQQVWATIAVEFVINAAMLLLVCFMLQGFMPQAAEETLPTVYAVDRIASAYNVGWLKVFYPILYLCAAITTGVSNIFAFTKRVCEVKRFKERMPKDKLRYAIVVTVVIIGCWGVAQIGFITIIKTLYSYVSTYAIFAIIIPVVVLGLRNIVKHKDSQEPALTSSVE